MLEFVNLTVLFSICILVNVSLGHLKGKCSRVIEIPASIHFASMN